jgi:excisionase family DNA binding protein
MENSVLIEKVTRAQLTDAINQAVKNQFEELKQELHKVRDQEELLTRHEAANLLKINITTLYHWTRKGKIPSYGIGNRVYYKRSEVLNSLVKAKY